MARAGLVFGLLPIVAVHGSSVLAASAACEASSCRTTGMSAMGSESLLMQVRSHGHFKQGRREASVWQLGMNINPSDGHDFGYRAEWDEEVDVGSTDAALSADYLSRAVWTKTIGHVAIARHNSGQCEAVKVWHLKASDQSMLQYFQSLNPGRMIVSDGVVFSFINESVTLPDHGADPIFGVDGELAFNWWYSNNGARLALDGGHLSCQDCNDDDTHGFGNEFGANTQNGQGSDAWTHDVANVQGDCHGGSCKIQGTDHGSHMESGPVYGQYAIYVLEASSEAVPDFPCEGGVLLAASMQATTTTTTTTALAKNSTEMLHTRCTHSNDTCAGAQCCPGSPQSGNKSYPCPSAPEGWKGCETDDEPPARCPHSDHQCSFDQCCPGTDETSGKTYPCPLSPGFQGCEMGGEEPQ